MIHVKTWSDSIRIIDMTNANKRGKTAKRFYIQGWTGGGPDETAAIMSLKLLAEGINPAVSYDVAVDAARALIARLTTARHITTDEDEIKAIDCPLPVLSAGLEGKWSGVADNDGIHLSDLTDMNNEPCEITAHEQSKTQAYKLAAKVWDKLADAKTMGQAADILTSAGCRLHYFCAVD